MILKTLVLATIAFSGSDAKIKKLIERGAFEKDKATVPQSQNIALGSCPCDLTLNSCDVYCCCDSDCSSEILAYWN